MRSLIVFGIFFGLLSFITVSVRAEFNIDKLTMKIGSAEEKEVEEDLYCYYEWQIKKLIIDMVSKFSWPKNNLNYSKLNFTTYLEDYRQLRFKSDYQWNERYRVFSPEINYYFKLGQDLKIGFDYKNQTRTPVLDEDREKRFSMGKGTVNLKLDKKDWEYLLELSQTQKGYPEDKPKNYTKNQLDHELAWRMGSDLKVKLSYFEATGHYPDDINIRQDFWKTETGIEGEYQFNDQWRVSGSYSDREEEKGLIPYLSKRGLIGKIKFEPYRNIDIHCQLRSADIQYYNEKPYIDPDGILFEEVDKKSRNEKSANLKCSSEYRKLNLTVETGFYWLSKSYQSPQVDDFDDHGLYATLCWNSGKIGLELEIAPEGNLWRRNGFYQLKAEYFF